ncbi:MAG: cytochrome c oxidase accessory protein CcoG [Planctomycetota bacterium]
MRLVDPHEQEDQRSNGGALVSLDPGEQVLTTLNQDGSRKWMKPRPSRGRFWKHRRVVAYGLIGLFTVLPHLRMNGKPVLLFDIAHREFTVFGTTFLPTDTLLLAMLFVTIFASIFFITAVLGRAWCGWACPQTVYMEFLYRPIERLFEGEPGKRKPKNAVGLRKLGKYAAFLLCSMFLAHTFLAYFVGTDALREWVTRSPLEHPVPFLIMAFVTGAMMFDFGFFREQVCILMCPYGRLQSVMLDKNSLIVGYDTKRGEPRGKSGRGKSKRAEQATGDVGLPILAEDQRGDCIDCTLCVQTCPTGIDIRDGLQLECIHCAQCIDACDAVMEKIGKPAGLIRYSSRVGFDGGARRLLRPRLFLYPTIIFAAVTVFTLAVAGKTGGAEVLALRGPGLPYNTLDSGDISNQVRLRVTNREDTPQAYTFSVVGPEGVRLANDPGELVVEPYAQGAVVLSIVVDPSAFEGGKCRVSFVATPQDGEPATTDYKLLGPSRVSETPPAETDGGSDE